MITSAANPQIKKITNLLLKSRVRRREKVFVAEGRKLFLEAPVHLIQKVYLSELFAAQLPENIRRKIEDLQSSGIETEIVSDNIFKSVSDTITPQGILSVVRQTETNLNQYLKVKNPLFVVLENIQDPGNLGTIIRTAEGAGVTAVIMNRGTVDVYNPKVIRSTMGAIFRVPFVYVEDLRETLSEFIDNDIKIYAAHLKDSVDYVTPSYIEGTALLIGNEGNGLTDEAISVAGNCIKIPMEGNVESLNASVAAALLMYEVYRQRRSK